MTDECKNIDPTGFGLLFVALVSLPIAIACILGYCDVDNHVGDYLNDLLKFAAIFIVIAALASYKINSNFGFTVFALVGLGVYFAGASGGDLYINLTLGLMYLVCLVWSVRAGTPKLLTCILLTTALIFIFGGLAGSDTHSIFALLKGIVALANFALNLYLGYALVDGKIPVY